MACMIKMSDYQMTIQDKIIAEGMVRFLLSVEPVEACKKIEEALKNSFSGLLYEAKCWNEKWLEDSLNSDDMQRVLNKEYLDVWKELVPEFYAKEIMPDFVRIFEDCHRQLKDAK